MRVMEKSDCLVKLLKALEQGWEIDEPVLCGSMWYARPDTEGNIYHVVLRNKSKGKTVLLSLPASSELLAFLAGNEIRVNAL